ncbi:uncharacterized protein LOC127842825 isoform X3 [Dreissena polymorpha]|uniref:uncharacterized protein LOC127842825 isoform X3 n=1 Tax=Dreissena polymorpha TaxID=45954 RepID=UPI0022640F1D|nr:uncharacterized protein LOC127842825 isoform X3 [Dreissena polymorpha]
MMAAEPVVKRMKNKNWNASETTILVERCVEGYSLLFGSHSPSVTEGKKDLYWKETIEMINAVGPGRSLHEAKRKWVDLKSSTKAKEKKIKKEVGKTGGGPAPDKLTPLEEKNPPLRRNLRLKKCNVHTMKTKWFHWLKMLHHFN